MRVTRTLHADAKPEQVIAYLIDPKAMPDVMAMEAVYESPAVAGNSYEWAYKMLGMTRKGVTVYTEYVPGERVAFRNFGGLEGTATWTVEPEDGGSKAIVEMEGHLPIPLIGRLFDPILRWQFEKNLAAGKRVIEEQSKVERTAA